MKTKNIAAALAFLTSSILGASPVEFDSVRLLPRRAFSTIMNGYTIEVSSDGAAWTNISTGNLGDDRTEKTIPVAKTSARFVKVTLTGESDAGAIAEMNLSLGGVDLPRTEWKASSDSESPPSGEYGPASFSIDGNPDTCWHTSWPETTPLPHHVIIDTGEPPIVGDRVTLAWDANEEPPLIGGYRIMYGKDPIAMDRFLPTEKVTEVTITGLDPGVWHFSAQARSTTDLVSEWCPSISVRFVANTSPAVTPTGVRIKPNP